MSSADKNLSSFLSTDSLPDISQLTFGIVVAEWNHEVTEKLFDGARQTLLDNGADPEKIIRGNVPGSYELTMGAQWFAQRREVDAVIAIGAVIRGETKHNDYINHAVAQGLTSVALKYDKPVIFGVLTPDNLQQAMDRAGGVHGNKGDEAAMTAIKMLGLKSKM